MGKIDARLAAARLQALIVRCAEMGYRLMIATVLENHDAVRRLRTVNGWRDAVTKKPATSVGGSNSMNQKQGEEQTYIVTYIDTRTGKNTYVTVSATSIDEAASIVERQDLNATITDILDRAAVEKMLADLYTVPDLPSRRSTLAPGAGSRRRPR